MLLHVDVLMAVRFARRVKHSSDYIDQFRKENLGKEKYAYGDLITVISLCATFYSLGYMHGKHDSKTQK